MRGRVTFEVAGREYALRFTTNRLCQLEEDSGVAFVEFLRKFEKKETFMLKDLRCLIRAGLEGEFTLEQAGDLIEQLGITEARRLAFVAIAAAFDQSAGSDAGKANAGRV